MVDDSRNGSSTFAARFVANTVVKKKKGGANYITTPYWTHPVEQVEDQYMSVPPHRKIYEWSNYGTNQPYGETTPTYGGYSPITATGRTDYQKSHYWGGMSQDRRYGKCDDHMMAEGVQVNWKEGFRFAVACAQASTGSDQSIDIFCSLYSATGNPTFDGYNPVGPRAWVLYNGRSAPCAYGMGATNGSVSQSSYLNTSSSSLSRYWCLMQAEFPAGMNGTGYFYMKIPGWVNGVFTGSNVLSHTITFDDAFSGVTAPLDGSYVLIKRYNGAVRHWGTWIGSLTDAWPFFDPLA